MSALYFDQSQKRSVPLNILSSVEDDAPETSKLSGTIGFNLQNEKTETQFVRNVTYLMYTGFCSQMTKFNIPKGSERSSLLPEDHYTPTNPTHS